MESPGVPQTEAMPNYRAVVGEQLVDLSRFGRQAIEWMERAEGLHKTRLFYSDEVQGGEFDLSVLKHAQNGVAKGFISKGKSFKKAQGYRPSGAIRQFIGGDKTVCECEGLMHAVIYNALCDVLGEDVFDKMFPDVPIGLAIAGADTNTSSEGFEKAITAPTGRSILPRTQGATRFEPGDWVYIFTGARGQFTEASVDSGRGAAAGGWNLIYVGDDRYMGFGLTGGGGRAAQAYTLDEIREKMVADLFDRPSKDVKTRRGSGDFSRGAAALVTSSPKAASSGDQRELLKKSIQVKFYRRLDKSVLTDWVRRLLH